MAYASSNLQGYGKREYKKETFEFIVMVDEIYEGGIVRLGLTAEEAKLAPQLYFLSRTIGALLGTFLLVRISFIGSYFGKKLFQSKYAGLSCFCLYVNVD